VARKHIDCRQYPSEMKCTVALSADTEQELLEAAVQHAVSIHNHKDTPDLRKQLKSMFKEGAPA
jgi:predicted small metal-binding protein